MLPKLRPCELKRIVHAGSPYLLLRDYMLGDDGAALLPWPLRGLALACDGEHDIDGLRAACLEFGGPALSRRETEQIVAALAQSGLIEGPHADAAVARALANYRAQPQRALSHAGSVYPDAPHEAAAVLRAYELRGAVRPLPAEGVAGVLSPHIDYARGGPIYAAGWSQAAAAVREARRVIVLGTDHTGGPGRLTFTKQRYATPWGGLGRDDELLDALTSVLGEERAFGEELHHRREHSIELASVWLRHLRGDEPLTVLPVLCGYHLPWFVDGLPGDDARLGAAIAILRAAVADGALVVVAGDFAHVGPEFGDGVPALVPGRDEVRDADQALIAACAQGANGLLQHAGPLDRRFRVCGLAPLALALAILPPVRLELAAYDQCPADAQNTSFVSVAGGAFVRT
jgi:MEMO1 family protein